MIFLNRTMMESGSITWNVIVALRYTIYRPNTLLPRSPDTPACILRSSTLSYNVIIISTRTVVYNGNVVYSSDRHAWLRPRWVVVGDLNNKYKSMNHNWTQVSIVYNENFCWICILYIMKTSVEYVLYIMKTSVEYVLCIMETCVEYLFILFISFIS